MNKFNFFFFMLFCFSFPIALVVAIREPDYLTSVCAAFLSGSLLFCALVLQRMLD